ncbi:MAG TPA: AAA family ATPase [Caulobacteraceae bacterium]|nr:AAA family ATPase [Caulobacteraceae bacterium]
MLSEHDTVAAFKALANDRRLAILEWLRAPRSHFREQVDGDLVEDGVCGLLIAEKLGVSQPTVSEHMRILTQAGLVTAKRIKQWTFYRRDEARLALVRRALGGGEAPAAAIQRGYVIVSGAPGAGKTTLATPLAHALGLPLFGKDLLKETLHDALPPSRTPLAWTRTLGGAAMELIWTLAAAAPAAVLEANFRPQSAFEREKLGGLGAPIVEVHCVCPPEVAAQRYAARHPMRHPTHIVGELTPELLAEFDRPMGLGPYVDVDTTRPVDIEDLAQTVLAAFKRIA